MRHHLRNIQVHRLHPQVLMAPGLHALLLAEAETVANLYRAKVAKDTGRLAASANASVVVGGHKHDRWVGKVTVGGTAAPYGVLHEFGARNKEILRAANDLKEIMRTRTAGT